MQALEKIYHPIPHVELISCSLVSDGFVLLFFFFALLALHVFTLFHRDVYGFQVTDQRDDTLTKLSLVFITFIYHCTFDAFLVPVGKISSNLLFESLANSFKLG